MSGTVQVEKPSLASKDTKSSKKAVDIESLSAHSDKSKNRRSRHDREQHKIEHSTQDNTMNNITSNPEILFGMLSKGK